jgi:glycosyltransferase involved in cell wall biosynthesis
MTTETPPSGPALRIAFVTDALVPFSSGGAERRVHELGIRLAGRHDVHVVSWGFWGPQPTTVRDGMTLHGVGRPRPFYGTDGRRTLREAVEFAARLPIVLSRLDVDVIDVSATPYLPLYGAWLGTRRSRTPVVATWHEFWAEHWEEYLPHRRVVGRAARAGESWARSLADRRVAVSPFTAARMDGGGRHPGANAIVGNGVDAASMGRARPDAERSDLVFVGRLIDEKRIDLLIRAVAALQEGFPAIRCLIVGDGPEREHLASLAAELGLDGGIVFVGRVEDARLPALLRGSKVFVMPSAREGYAITVVEAQACGLVPVVARSPLSAAPDLIDDGVDGLISEPTVAGLAAAIGGLLADPARRRQMAAAARRSAATHDWAERAAAMERIYRDAIATRPSRRRRGGRSLADQAPAGVAATTAGDPPW